VAAVHLALEQLVSLASTGLLVLLAAWREQVAVAVALAVLVCLQLRVAQVLPVALAALVLQTV